MMQNTPRIYDIEALVFEAEMFRIINAELSWKTHHSKMLTSRIDRCLSKIHSGIIGTVQSKHHSIGAIATTNLQQGLVFRFGEGNEEWNMPFCSISKLPILIEKISFILEVCNEVRTARFNIPKGLNVNLL